MCEVTDKSREECETVLRRLRPRPNRVELAMHLLMGGPPEMMAAQHLSGTETMSASCSLKSRKNLKSCLEYIAKSQELQTKIQREQSVNPPNVDIKDIAEWISDDCKFVQITASYTELLALGDDKRLYCWRWQSGERGRHQRALALCSSDSITKVASSALRTTLLTSSGRVASFMDDTCHRLQLRPLHFQSTTGLHVTKVE